jgi:hypothetical protein
MNKYAKGGVIKKGMSNINLDEVAVIMKQGYSSLISPEYADGKEVSFSVSIYHEPLFVVGQPYQLKLYVTEEDYLDINTVCIKSCMNKEEIEFTFIIKDDSIYNHD